MNKNKTTINLDDLPLLCLLCTIRPATHSAEHGESDMCDECRTAWHKTNDNESEE